VAAVFLGLVFSMLSACEEAPIADGVPTSAAGPTVGSSVAASTSAVIDAPTVSTIVVEPDAKVVAPVVALLPLVEGTIDHGGAVLSAVRGDDVFDREEHQAFRFYASIEIRDVDVLWAPSPSARADAESLTELRMLLDDATENWLLSDASGTEIVALWNPLGQGTSLVAPVADDRSENPGMVGVLHDMMRSLPSAEFAVSLDDEQSCGPAGKPDPGLTELEALLLHVRAAEKSIVGREHGAWIIRTAERLTEELAMEDLLTGIRVTADINDIERQLQSGVAEGDVVAWPVVPALVDTRAFDGEPMQTYLLAEDGTILGHFPVSRVDTEYMISLPLPHEPGPISVVFAPTGLLACEQLPDDLIDVMALPYEAVGGDTRVVIDFGTGSYTALSGPEFVALIEARTAIDQ
jgi:hypothetical protein